ncbi:MAG: hypothetical protein PHS82_14350 [Lachnospiraceae bacterium]|nr:hypothetical protein [Lachnospiraceae bacterium]
MGHRQGNLYVLPRYSKLAGQGKKKKLSMPFWKKKGVLKWIETEAAGQGKKEKLSMPLRQRKKSHMQKVSIKTFYKPFLQNFSTNSFHKPFLQNLTTNVSVFQLPKVIRYRQI